MEDAPLGQAPPQQGMATPSLVPAPSASAAPGDLGTRTPQAPGGWLQDGAVGKGEAPVPMHAAAGEYRGDGGGPPERAPPSLHLRQQQSASSAGMPGLPPHVTAPQRGMPQTMAATAAAAEENPWEHANRMARDSEGRPWLVAPTRPGVLDPMPANLMPWEVAPAVPGQNVWHAGAAAAAVAPWPGTPGLRQEPPALWNPEVPRGPGPMPGPVPRPAQPPDAWQGFVPPRAPAVPALQKGASELKARETAPPIWDGKDIPKRWMKFRREITAWMTLNEGCLLYTSPSPRD